MLPLLFKSVICQSGFATPQDIFCCFEGCHKPLKDEFILTEQRCVWHIEEENVSVSEATMVKLP